MRFAGEGDVTMAADQQGERQSAATSLPPPPIFVQPVRYRRPSQAAVRLLAPPAAF
jgi:hypothetical protein